CGFLGSGFLCRLPFQRFCAKQGCELGQGDRLFRGVNNGFQPGFKAHAAISTLCMVLDERGGWVHRGRMNWIVEKRERPGAPNALRSGTKPRQPAEEAPSRSGALRRGEPLGDLTEEPEQCT